MNLAAVLREWRYAKRLGVREAATMIGLTMATYNRAERGLGMDGRTLSAILRWLLSESTHAHP